MYSSFCLLIFTATEIRHDGGSEPKLGRAYERFKVQQASCRLTNILLLIDLLTAMALDSSLFTLNLQRRPNDSSVLDLIPFSPAAAASTSSSPSQPEPLYSFLRARSTDYNVQLIDHLTSIPLSSIVSPSSGDKIRKIDLYNPDESVIFEKKSSFLRQDWRWTWQEQEYLIRRDGRALIVEAFRQPDPEIDIARYTPATKSRAAFLQVLDYNVQRLEVADRRGLEVLILTAICTLLDLESDEKHKDDPLNYTNNLLSPPAPSSSAQSRTPSHTPIPAAPNEIIIDAHSPADIYVQHAIHLMRQDEGGEGLHLIIIKASSPQCTPKAVQVAAEIKLKWYRLQPIAKGRTLDPLPGSTSEIAEELYQYVRDPSLVKTSPSTPPKEDQAPIGQRRRIKLDAPTSSPPPSASPAGHSASPSKNNKSYLAPPEQLDIYLSKERIDELEMTSPASSSLARHAPSSPARTAAPLIPPKGTKQSVKNDSHTENSGHTKKTFLGKLGIRKANEG
jgi:hypothetical protein